MTLNSSLSVFRPIRSVICKWSVVYVTNIQFSLKLYDLKIESFFPLDSSFYIKKHFNKETKIHSSLFLSLAITGIDVNDIIRYPSSSLKYHITSILTVF